MTSCVACAAPLAPGATFCRGCGEGVGVASSTLRSPSWRRPHIAMAAMVAMPVTVLALILVQQVRPDSGVSLENFLAPGLMTVVIAPLLWGLARRAAWARVVSIVANLGWGVFMAWVGVIWVDLLRRTEPAARGDFVAEVVTSAVQVALVFFALVDLVWPRSAATSTERPG